MMFNRIVFRFLIAGTLFSSCSEECQNPCLSNDNFRIDTIESEFLDTMLIMGGSDAIVAYTDSMGGEMLFNVSEYRFDYPSYLIKSACGECGDSVTTQRHRSEFFYNMDNSTGLNVSITLTADQEFRLDDKIYQCTEGEIMFNDIDGSSCSTKFAAECNGFLTPSTGEIINGARYNLAIDSSATLACSPSDTTYAVTDCVGSIESFYINDSIPISHFSLNGTCWHFDGIR